MSKFISAFIFSFCSLAIAKQTPKIEIPIDTTTSKVSWVGSKLDMSKHNGSVGIQSGKVKIVDGVLKGGTLVIDMNSIKNFDVEDKKWKAKLENHLKSEDFFFVKDHPTATYTISSVRPVKGKPNTYDVSGTLNIRGTDQTEKMRITMTKVGKAYKATGSVKINRMNYNITFKSSKEFLEQAKKIVKDQVISNEFELTFEVMTQAT